MHASVCVCLAVPSRHVVRSSTAGTLYFKEFSCLEAYCALCFFLMSSLLRLLGRNSDRTVAELEAVLTVLQLVVPSRGLFGHCCSVFFVMSVARRS